MADEFTGADSIRWYLTGAGSDGAFQGAHDTSLGSFRSCVELPGVGVDRILPVTSLRIRYASGQNGIGDGSLNVSAVDTLTWTPPGGATGVPVKVLANEVKQVCGLDVDQYLIVERFPTGDLRGRETVRLMDVFGTAMGFDDVSDAEATAGDTEYRALMAKNESAGQVDALKIWLELLGAQAVSDTTQLAGAGAGTLATTGNFANWPERGGCRIETSGGTLREIIYYSGRDGQNLTVPAAGRGLLGSTAAAGAATDVLKPVPLLRIALETPTASALTDKTGLGEGSQPGGLAWITGVDAAGGLSAGSLAASGLMGLWNERTAIVGHVADPYQQMIVKYSFMVGATTHFGQLRGLYRVENLSLVGFEVYRSLDGAAIDYDSPFDTFTASPREIPTALIVSKEHHFVLRKRNRFNVVSQNVIDPDNGLLVIESDGSLKGTRPTAPDSVRVISATGGQMQIEALYRGINDAAADLAETWVIYMNTDGTDPDTSLDTPVATVAMAGGGGTEFLSYLSAAVALDESDVRVIVTARRTGNPDVDSLDSNTGQFTVNNVPPGIADGAISQGLLAQFTQGVITGAPTGSDDYVVDADNNIRLEPRSGSVSFYGDTVLIWRCIFDSCGKESWLYIPSDWDLDDVTAVGAGGSADAIEVLSWTAPDKRLGVNVNGVRVMDIDVTNKVIVYGSRNDVDGYTQIRADAAVWPRVSETRFQVWDPASGNWWTYMTILANGEWRKLNDENTAGTAIRRVYRDQTLTQGAIEAL